MNLSYDLELSPETMKDFLAYSARVLFKQLFCFLLSGGVIFWKQFDQSVTTSPQM
jgi:hypothetical protein